jgi:putative DNA methylase
MDSWRGTHGLAADIRYYGAIIREGLQKQIGNLYPKARLSKEHGGGEATVIAWLWARTVTSDNPSAQARYVPLISTYWLSTAAGKKLWLRPIVDKQALTYRFDVESSTPPDSAVVRAGTKIGRGGRFRCILTDTPIKNSHLKTEGISKRLGLKLLAVVATSAAGRIYLPASESHEAAARLAPPDDAPNELLRENARYLTPTSYGMRTMDSLFTARQLTALTTLSRLIQQIKLTVINDAKTASMAASDASAYADTVVTFLGLALDRCADFNNAFTRWSPSNQKVMNMFGRQAIPMLWDFAEANILADSVGGWTTCSDYVADCAEVLGTGHFGGGFARQLDAASGANGINDLLVSTDPPYYDNVPYADISDFFYVWLRRTIGQFYPDVCSTLLVPKTQELTASPDRFEGDKDKAKEHFESGFRKAFTALREKMDRRFPLTVYYAFKQDDEESGADDDNENTSG